VLKLHADWKKASYLRSPKKKKSKFWGKSLEIRETRAGISKL
jgi:hypothetical protein